ncbi:Peptidyl-prolyl cis-trans isomerase-like 3 [Porphyridium purpureum]|uniref:Peptidyl-prolyl cis-trans isomerase n=1 Tax=Porphyridium purpureum TaxID=35688 RepID=A0A5J4YVU4_PORPP|nr:Peptidyl-prolyl cis-trans isomerase-like 3 [Porphyridium purpureum]|eukprot:POR9652..scf227_4
MAVTLHTTRGPLKLELECEQCPIASKNFLALCASGFYNGVVFHRVIPRLLVQGGSDPHGVGTVNKSIYGAPFEDEAPPSGGELLVRLAHRGVLATASAAPDQNGSQFLITLGALPGTAGVGTVFGRVIDGWETLQRIESSDTDPEVDRPVAPIAIESVTIHANPFAEMTQ